MSINSIRKQLITALEAVGLTWPIRWENVAFTVPPSGKWLAVGFWPLEPETVTLGAEGMEQCEGWLQVDLNVPPNMGEAELLDNYQELRTAFPPGRGFSSDGVDTTILSCGRSPGRRVDETYRISVTIRFRARYNKNT